MGDEVDYAEAARREGSACEECGSGVAKYKCPRCLVRTCSLACSKAHKLRTQCTGKRDVTKYVPKDEFDERVMFSDIAFLDGVKRARDVANRSRPVPPRKTLPPFLNNLRFQARKRGVRLLFLQPGMKRRKENTTCCSKPNNFFWRVEWYFPSAQGATFSDSRLSDRTVIRDALARHLAPPTASGSNSGGSSGCANFAAAGHDLSEYAKCGADRAKVFLAAHKFQGEQRVYWELDTSKTVGEALCGKTVLEFPRFEVALPRDLHTYARVASPAAPDKGD